MSAGRIVWRELVTPNPSQTANFYSQLFGWSLNTVDMGMPEPYVMMHNDTVDVDTAGATAPAMDGVPPHWVDYITTDDTDAACAKVTEHGGKVLAPAMTVPGVGRFAIVADPTGAVFGVLASEEPGATDTESRPPAHTFCWSQLMTSNLDAVVPFYNALFGWTAEPMGPGMVVFKDGEAMRGSAMAQPEGAPPMSHWLKYVAVDEVEPALQQAQSLGAQMHVPVSEIPGMGKFSVLADPSGAVFALWKDLSDASAS